MVDIIKTTEEIIRWLKKLFYSNCKITDKKIKERLLLTGNNDPGNIMKKSDEGIQLQGRSGSIHIKRGPEGIPAITCSSMADAVFAQGFCHARDRMLQICLTREILYGRASEKIADLPELLQLDRFMRGMNFYPDIETEIKRLTHETREQLERYAEGINAVINAGDIPLEFKLLKIKPEPWNVRDTLMLGKIFTFLGLADAQGAMEKLLVQMIQHRVDEKKLRELFPYLVEKIDYELLSKVTLSPPLVPEALKWLSIIPKFTASNNWSVSGKHTESGKPILCGDPHLEVNRIPAIWYETSIQMPDNYMLGVSFPGTPGILLGRTAHTAWSPTYSFMDMIDYRIEECAGGKYRRGNKWVPFNVREETIKTKKGRSEIIKIYENEHGTLEGDPEKEGFYLVRCWSAQRGCGASEFNTLLSLPSARTARELMKKLLGYDASSFCFAVADVHGNIGLQMSGRSFNRPKHVSGLLPLPGWDKMYDSRGFADKNKLPSSYNPADGIIVSANNDVNHLGRFSPINLPMAPYRAERIRTLLEKRKNLSVDYMKQIHYDLYSNQAEALIPLLLSYIPDTKAGLILKTWDMKYTEGSVAASIFENIYISLLKIVFGAGGSGNETFDYLMKETSIFTDYYGNFDRILLKSDSVWFRQRSRESCVIEAVNTGLSMPAAAYGKTRKVTMAHLLFGGKFPAFFGFDKVISLPGGRATVTQGQIFRSGGRTTTFSPSYRFIADMSKNEIHTNMPGGVRDRRFSVLYLSDLKNWMAGIYKVLKCTDTK